MTMQTKTRVIQDGKQSKYLVQYRTIHDDAWLIKSDPWKFLTYIDDEGHENRYVFSTLEEAVKKAKDVADSSWAVVWQSE